LQYLQYLYFCTSKASKLSTRRFADEPKRGHVHNHSDQARRNDEHQIHALRVEGVTRDAAKRLVLSLLALLVQKYNATMSTKTNALRVEGVTRDAACQKKHKTKKKRKKNKKA
jgi:hypothetical protein